MNSKTSLVVTHPKGEQERVGKSASGPIALDTFGGRVHVEWSPQAAVTPLGQLPFFIDFLKTADLYDPWIEESPLEYKSPNAPKKRDVLSTLFLSLLAGHWRYAHITTIRCDNVNPDLLGMEQIVSEDSVRRGLSQFEDKKAAMWLRQHIKRCYEPLLYEKWILDTDATVKPLYGKKQEGAVVGYNPEKPGRPSHVYHSYFISNIRLLLDVEVSPGNETAACYSQPGLWRFIDELPKAARPEFIRGDNAWGNESAMCAAEDRGVDYLFKLRQTKGVQELMIKMFGRDDWVESGQGWEGLESELCLQGWSKKRRVLLLRREIRGHLALTSPAKSKKSKQLILAAEFRCGIKRYEYGVLVTSLTAPIDTIAQHYRDRGDVENNFDELKNQWSWGGFTTKDLKRCRIIARTTALIYNWWSLFVRLAIPQHHREAITSRPLLLHAIGKKTQSGGQTKVSITSSHAKSNEVREILCSLSTFLKKVRTAEQLSWYQKWMMILSRVFVKFLRGRPLRGPPLLSPSV